MNASAHPRPNLATLTTAAIFSAESALSRISYMGFTGVIIEVAAEGVLRLYGRLMRRPRP